LPKPKGTMTQVGALRLHWLRCHDYSKTDSSINRHHLYTYDDRSCGGSRHGDRRAGPGLWMSGEAWGRRSKCLMYHRPKRHSPCGKAEEVLMKRKTVAWFSAALVSAASAAFTYRSFRRDIERAKKRISS